MKKRLFVVVGMLLALAVPFLGPAGQQVIDETGQSSPSARETAYFAGGCFWCVESDFEKQPGVIDVTSGYTGGKGNNPSYRTYADQGYFEAVRIIYDPDVIHYKELLDIFWRHIDPTDGEGQFVDRGPQYRAAIVYLDQEQNKLAEESKAVLAKSSRFAKPIVTEILPFNGFFEAEEYHQDYAKKNPLKYHFYRFRSGRDQFLAPTWEKEHDNRSSVTSPAFSDASKKEQVQPTPLQCKVPRLNTTEPPFDNEYWNNKQAGIYVDIYSGEPLFSSVDKYDSGTGWPSFTRPLEPENIMEKKDRSLFTVRTEARSKGGDSHLGHVFSDGPAPTGKRYCINSAALRFIAKEDMQVEGYAEYLRLFEQGAKL